jgi:hypothetical protein
MLKLKFCLFIHKIINIAFTSIRSQDRCCVLEKLSYPSTAKVEHTPTTSTSPATTVASSVLDTPVSANATDNSVFLSTPASANKCTPPGEGEALIRAQQIRIMTLISKLKDLKDVMTKNNNTKKCFNKKENTTSVPDTSSSLNQSLDSSLMNSQTFDVQDPLLSEDSDNVKAVFKSSFDDDEDKQEGGKECSNKGTILFDVSCIDTSVRKHISDGDEVAEGSAPKCAYKSEKEGEKKKGVVVEEDDDDEKEEERKKDDDDDDDDADMGNKDDRLNDVCKFCGLDRCFKKDLQAFCTAHFYHYLHVCKKGEANYEDALEHF